MKKKITKNTAKALESTNRVDYDLAWRIHDNAKDWIAQVDIKATAALAIEAVLLGFAITLSSVSAQGALLTTLSNCLLGLSILLLATSVLLSVLVIIPRIKPEKSSTRFTNYLYFGHLRHWERPALTQLFQEGASLDEDQLSGQIILLSKISWRKHVLLKWSLGLLIGGLVLFTVLFLLLITQVSTGAFGCLNVALDQGGVLTCR